jgi:hypothetical protein
LWNEDVFDILVQFVQDEIRKYGTKHPSLWNSTMGLVIAPFLHISCSQEVIDETDKTVVVDLLAKDLEQKALIDSVEKRTDISLHIPFHASPALCHLLQSSMAPPTWSEPM